jgi:hypothetical protein
VFQAEAQVGSVPTHQGVSPSTARASTSHGSDGTPSHSLSAGHAEILHGSDDRHGMRTPAGSAPRPAPPILHSKQQQVSDSWPWQHDTLTVPHDNPDPRRGYHAPCQIGTSHHHPTMFFRHLPPRDTVHLELREARIFSFSHF